MQKTWLCCACLALGLIGAVTTAGASQYPEADRYYGARDGRRIVEKVTFAQVQMNAARWKDALIEVRGVIHGCARRDERHFIISREEGDTFVINARQALPESTCRISRAPCASWRAYRKTAASFGSLEMVAVTSEYEAASLDYERAKRRTAARPAARPTSRRMAMRQALSRREALRRGRRRQTMLASRGLDALGQYAAAVQWFNPRLTEADAHRLAQSIIYYSVHHGLDARLDHGGDCRGDRTSTSMPCRAPGRWGWAS